MLVGNGSNYCKNPMRTMAGTQVMNDLGSAILCPGAKYNQRESFGPLASIPIGYAHPVSWVMAFTAGAMSSRKAAEIDIAAGGQGACGLGGAAAATLEILAEAIGSLIAGAIGSGEFLITATGDIVATITTTGQAPIQVNAEAIISALGWLSATGLLEIAAAMESYGIGWISGTTDYSETLTAQNIAAAVWASLPAGELPDIPDTVTTPMEMIQFLFEYFKNKRTVTEALETLFKADGATPLGAAVLDDDGTTTTKGEMN